ncbi:hypothetical protein FOL47_000181 [Perkinsus chesapeaki]|uniref:FCH domain-containing protein n=1 Tax=Perkinsus chesapeaki TaxID=330153 RepID=A0A7J6KYZ3_PERCH|nr:hypothetical protein FOL47_000181 [Perkinsus chesapeaki]
MNDLQGRKPSALDGPVQDGPHEDAEVPVRSDDIPPGASPDQRADELAEAAATAVPASTEGSLAGEGDAAGDEAEGGYNQEAKDSEEVDSRAPEECNIGSVEEKQMLPASADFKDLLIDDFPGVCERLERSHRLCDRLRILLEERANIERSYAAGLERLARKARDSAITDTCGSETALAAFDGYLGVLTHRAEQSKQLATDLAGEVVPPLTGTLRQHGQVYQRIRVDGLKLSSGLHEQYRLHDDIVLRYDKAAKRADHLMVDLEADGSNDPGSRLRLAVAAGEAARLASGCEEDYKKAVHEVNAERQRFVAHMDVIMDALQDMEVKRERCFKDALRKTVVYDAAWLRNVEYDLNQAIPGVEGVDPEKDTAEFARSRYAKRSEATKGGVGRATLLEKVQVLPWQRLQRSLHPNGSAAAPAESGKKRAQKEEEVDTDAVGLCDKLLDTIWEGDKVEEGEEASQALVAGLRDQAVRLNFCEKLREKARENSSLEGGMSSLKALAKACGVALDLADQQMDGETAGQIAGVSLKVSAGKEDGKRQMLMQELYYHPIWSRVLIWEDILLWAIAEACMDEQRKRAGWPERNQEDRGYMVDVENFGEVLLHYGVQASNGRDLVGRCIGRMDEPLGRGALDDIKGVLLNGLAVAEAKQSQPSSQPPAQEVEEEEGGAAGCSAAREDVFA